MNRSERNDYIETMKPILYLMKMGSILPVPFTFKDYGDNFLKSRSVLAIALCIYHINMLYTITMVYILTDNLWRKFSMKILVALAPSFLAKLSIFMVPLTIWSKTKQMEFFWIKWQQFQSDFKKVTGKEFKSDTKTMSFWCSIISISLTIIADIMGHLYLFQNTGIVGVLSDSINNATAYIIGAYWFMNYMYLRSCGMVISSLVNETLAEGCNSDRLWDLANLWISLGTLMEQFNVLHSSMFLVYTSGATLSTILFAYISMNYSSFSDTWGRGTTYNSTAVCALMILVICEMGYSVYKQVNIKQREILLEHNTTAMKVEMLQSISLFSNTVSFLNPEIHLNGFFALNRAVFPTILGVCVNYLIVLRQFQPKVKSTHQ